MQKKSSNTIEQQKHSHKISNANIQMHMVKMNVSTDGTLFTNFQIHNKFCHLYWFQRYWVVIIFVLCWKCPPRMCPLHLAI